MGVLTPDGTVVDVNRAALEFGGLTLADVAGRPFWEAGWWQAHPHEQERLREAIAAAAAGAFVRYETDLEAGSTGAPHTLDFSLKPVRSDTGEVTFLIAEARDITETKWAERALRVSEAKFAGMIAIASDAIISVDETVHDHAVQPRRRVDLRVCAGGSAGPAAGHAAAGARAQCA
jgi:PAS domain S-box-containing protein